MTDDMPVAQISRNDALAYCKWLSDDEKSTYRLPTEAEWEYACRAGTTNQYSFGDDHNRLVQFGWYERNSGRKANPVGTRAPNAFGLFDMHGNIVEWCQDFYDRTSYPRTSPGKPVGSVVNYAYVLRGGHWRQFPPECRSAFRSGNLASARDGSCGFALCANSMLHRPALTLKSIRTAARRNGS